MDRKFLAPIVGVATVIAALLSATPAAAQTYGYDLPPGVIEVSVGNAPSATTAVNAVGVLVVNTATPTIRGRIEPGRTSVEIVIRSQELRFTVPVDPVTGEFEFTVPVALSSGEHSLYIDDAFVGTFTVALVTPPSSGNAGLASNGSGPGAITIALTALGVVAVGALGIAARRRRGRGA